MTWGFIYYYFYTQPLSKASLCFKDNVVMATAGTPITSFQACKLLQDRWNYV